MNSIAAKKIYNKPIIGVFVGNIYIRKLNNNLGAFKNSKNYCRFIELAKANKEANTTLYFFSSRDIDFSRSIIHGTYFNEEKCLWEKKEFPFPEILYDRGGGNKNNSINIRKYFRKKGIKKINAKHYFNKWKVYNLLEKNKAVRTYLPYTIHYENTEDLRMMLEKFGTVYIKSNTGKRGKYVLRIHKLSEDSYEYSYYRSGRLKVKQVNFHRLLTRIHTFFNQRKVIIQQAINLPVINSSIVDMRAEVQRNGRGKIEIVEILVRVSNPGAPITTTKQSGIYTFQEYCQQYAPPFLKDEKDISTLKKQINNFLLSVYQCMEERYGRFGEIAIDFAVDIEGKIWFIECNGKSAKVSLCKTKQNKIIHRAFLNPLQYAKLLDYD